MIIYSVTMNVDASVSEEYLHWLHKEHLHDMMNTGLFLSYNLYKFIEPCNHGSETFMIQFFCNNIENYRTYISKYSENMRRKTPQIFEGMFTNSRVVMEEIF